MADSHVGTDIGSLHEAVNVNDCSILDIGAGADPNRLLVTADDTIEPDTDSLGDFDITDQDRSVGNKGFGRNAGPNTAIR